MKKRLIERIAFVVFCILYFGTLAWLIFIFFCFLSVIRRELVSEPGFTFLVLSVEALIFTSMLFVNRSFKSYLNLVKSHKLELGSPKDPYKISSWHRDYRRRVYVAVCWFLAYMPIPLVTLDFDQVYLGTSPLGAEHLVGVVAIIVMPTWIAATIGATSFKWAAALEAFLIVTQFIYVSTRALSLPTQACIETVSLGTAVTFAVAALFCVSRFLAQRWLNSEAVWKFRLDDREFREILRTERDALISGEGP